MPAKQGWSEFKVPEFKVPGTYWGLGCFDVSREKGLASNDRIDVLAKQGCCFGSILCKPILASCIHANDPSRRDELSVSHIQVELGHEVSCLASGSMLIAKVVYWYGQKKKRI